jgi:hypothetical protein
MDKPQKPALRKPTKKQEKKQKKYMKLKKCTEFF